MRQRLGDTIRPLASAILLVVASKSVSQSLSPSLYDCLSWRCIGPFRAGRTVGAVGIPEQPNTFFVGVNNGGVWKTTDAGRTWKPIFDDQPTGSIGDVAVAPSNPNVLYVGTGEGLQRPDLATGNGMYRSDDGGKTWKHLGLDNVQQIGSIIVDPRDPMHVYVAALGHPYNANPERGVYESKDGGATWAQIFYKDENTCAIQLAFNPKNPDTIYVDMWEAQLGPWENSVWQGPGSGLYKSTDAGKTWKPLSGGLPTFENGGLGRIGFCIAPSDPNRMYATVDAPELGGIYRSDDAGENWKRMSEQPRLWGRGSDFAEVKVDPLDPDKLYVANTSLYRSDDGGLTYTCIKGSPGGDDYHRIWINPLHPEIILTGVDQGATISVNGGETWSSWYNQPTAQFYHVSTDNQVPYWVYGGQQESGSVGTSSRGNDGQITFREWHPVGVEEYGYVAADPLNPNLIYGGKVTRYDRRTGLTEFVGPDRAKLGLRFLRTAPVLFSPVDKKALYLGANVLLRTRDGGKKWDVISPDLTRVRPEVPDSIGKYRTPDLATMKQRGVIYTVAPSYKNKDVIWCGTDDGLIHRTADGGKTWTDVTPPGLTAWSKVSIIDAGRFDDKTAYAAINRIRLDDQRPHIYRTHDGGATWKEIVSGLPSGPVNAVREDTKRKGLLFCVTETAVYFSLDDGDNWNPLRLNMPATSIRDLVVHEDDLVLGTHGRSFWIMDNFSMLRHLPNKAVPTLFEPPLAYQFERNANTDTPLPPEEPAGKNPPDGAMIDYWLPGDAAKVVLELVDSSGKVVRTYSSSDPVPTLDPNSITVMPGWVRPPAVLSGSAGAHRFIWDLRVAPPSGGRQFLPISAIWGDTPFVPLGDWVKPGKYTVRLTVDGTKLEKHIEVKADPRKARGHGQWVVSDDD